jgi:hypothetical protein
VNEYKSVKDGIYHIRVQGNLDERWADWFEGFVMTARDGGETLLSGVVVDQAALHGVLGKIRGLGLPLLLVARTDCPCTNKNCARHGKCQECAAHYGDNGKQPYCYRARTKWDKQCAALAKVEEDAQVRSDAQEMPSRADRARKKREKAEPKSLLGRFWT